VKKKLKCFWSGRKYVDLIGHSKRQHPGRNPRSYDIEKEVLKIYGSLIMPVHLDPALQLPLVEMTRRTTPLMDLIPRVGDKKEAVPEPVTNKPKVWIDKLRVKISYWIGGQALKDDMDYDDMDYDELDE